MGCLSLCFVCSQCAMEQTVCNATCLLVQQRKPSVILAEVESLPQASLLISCEHVVINQDLQNNHVADRFETLLCRHTQGLSASKLE